MSTPGTTTYVPSTFTDLTHAQLLTELKRLGLGLAAASGNLVEVAAQIGQVATGGYVHTQSTPATTWTIPHTLGRPPAVTVLVGGEQVFPGVVSTTINVVITWAGPAVGTAVLT